MGRNYLCEYCDKRFKDDPNIRKKHFDGLQHQRAKKEHYANFKDAKTILEEESQKAPCSWYLTGSCQFGASCRQSHYTPIQMMEIQQMAAQTDYNAWLKTQPKQFNQQTIENFLERRRQRKITEARDAARRLWRHPESLMENVADVPPSLEPIDPALIPNELAEWG